MSWRLRYNKDIQHDSSYSQTGLFALPPHHSTDGGSI